VHVVSMNGQENVGDSPGRCVTANAGGGAGGGGAFIEADATSVTLVSSVSPCATSCALKSPPVTAAFSVVAVVDVRVKSKKDTVYSTFTAVYTRVLIRNELLD